MITIFRKLLGWTLLTSGAMALTYAIIKTFGLLILGCFVATAFLVLGLGLITGE